MLIYIITVLVSLIIAFLCGSIPVALAIGKSMRGLDIREHGSGNAGSANAVRVLGFGPGLLVFVGDVLKGALGCVIVTVATGIAVLAVSSAAVDQATLLMQSGTEVLEFDPIISIVASDYSSLLYEIPRALAIIAAILGHMFSPVMSFKGGKGVATALGAIAVTLPIIAICSLTVFVIVVLITRYVSLSSIVAVSTVPIFTIFFPIASNGLLGIESVASQPLANSFLTFVSTAAPSSLVFSVFTVVLALVVIWAHRKNIGRLLRKEEPKFSLRKKEAV